MSEWLAAGLAVIAGVLLGAAAGWLVRRLLRSRPGDAAVVERPAATFLFWFFAAVGVVVAIGIVSPASFESVPNQLLAFFPRILVAGLILLGSWGLASFLGRLMSRGVAASGGSGRVVERSTRAFILTTGTVFALAQLGIDTTILTILIAGLVFFVALAAALLVGFGGRAVANNLAAGRYLERHVAIGDNIIWRGDGVRVIQLHPAAVEAGTDDGKVVFIPNAALLDEGFSKSESD